MSIMRSRASWAAATSLMAVVMRSRSDASSSKTLGEACPVSTQGSSCRMVRLELATHGTLVQGVLLGAADTDISA